MCMCVDVLHVFTFNYSRNCGGNRRIETLTHHTYKIDYGVEYKKGGICAILRHAHSQPKHTENKTEKGKVNNCRNEKRNANP